MGSVRGCAGRNASALRSRRISFAYVSDFMMSGREILQRFNFYWASIRDDEVPDIPTIQLAEFLGLVRQRNVYAYNLKLVDMIFDGVEHLFDGAVVLDAGAG